MRGHIRRTGRDNRPLNETGVRIGRDSRSFTAVIDVGRDSNGKRQQKWRSFPTKAEAESWLAEIVGPISRGAYTEPTKATVQELVEAWLAAGAPGKKSRDGLKASTLAGYADIAWRYIFPTLGKVRAIDLHADAVGLLYRELESRGLSSRTITYTATVLSACLGDAVRKGRLAKNAAEGARLPRRQKVRDSAERTWTAKQRRDFLNGCQDDPLHAAFYLTAHTGLRRGEVAGLRWQDVDFASGRLTVAVNRVLVRKPGEDGKYHVDVVDDTPKSHRPRTIYVDEGTLAVLQQHRVRQMQSLTALHGPDSPMATDCFTDWDGGRLSPDTLSYRFELAVKKSGLPYTSLHGLRHCWASLALQAGVPVQVVSEMLGHKSVNVTWNVYQHVIPSQQAEAAAKVAAL